MPLLAEGEFALAEKHLKQALNKEGRGYVGVHDLYAMLVDAATQQRDEVALRDYAPILEKEATQLDHKLHLAIAHRGWGVLHTLAGEFTEARPRLDQALALFSELDTRWQIGRTHFELGELAIARSDTTEARKHYASALELFEAMGAAPDASKARKALESIGS